MNAKKKPGATSTALCEVLVKFKEGPVLNEVDGKLSAPHLDLKYFESLVASIKGAEYMRSCCGDVKRLRRKQDGIRKRIGKALVTMLHLPLYFAPADVVIAAHQQDFRRRAYVCVAAERRLYPL